MGKRYALIVVLGYSRHLWLQFYPRQSMQVRCQGVEAAFRFFGGVAHELMFDQLKAVVIEDQRLAGGRVLENPEFLRFAAHWGFRIRVCRPYRARTKGKVERPIRYIRQSLVYGRSFVGDADLNAQSLHWLATVANVREHQTTKERPRPYQALRWRHAPATPPRLRPRVVEVERRPLAAYAQLVEATASGRPP